MKPSEVSAARYLALRAIREKAEAGARDRLRLGRERAAATRLAARMAKLAVSDCWRYVEAHFPGVAFAWTREIGLPTQGFVFGVTGKPPTAVAVDLGCYTPGYTRCRCHSFRRGKWRPMCHPPIVCEVRTPEEQRIP